MNGPPPRLGYQPYEPQNVPVQFAKNIWTVEGPEAAYVVFGLTIPCPTRMTVIKLANGDLCLHSPIRYNAELDQELQKIGQILVIIAPNTHHHLHVGSWMEKYPKASVYALPETARILKIKEFQNIGSCALGLSADFDQAFVDLGSFKETVLFHNASSTLIVTDLMQTFEEDRIRSLFVRKLMKIVGATGPNARPSMEVRLAGLWHRRAMHAAVRQIAEWQPQQVILSHGRCIRSNAAAEIEKAFDWVGQSKT